MLYFYIKRGIFKAAQAKHSLIKITFKKNLNSMSSWQNFLQTFEFFYSFFHLELFQSNIFILRTSKAVAIVIFFLTSTKIGEFNCKVVYVNVGMLSLDFYTLSYCKHEKNIFSILNKKT